jgi:hypothetical protein
VVGILPVGAVNDGINAKTFDTHTALPGAGDLLGNLMHPAAASHTKVTGLTHHHRSPIAVVHLGQQ